MCVCACFLFNQTTQMSGGLSRNTQRTEALLTSPFNQHPEAGSSGRSTRGRAPLRPLSRVPLLSVDRAPLRPLSRVPLLSVDTAPLRPLSRVPLLSVERAPLRPLSRVPLLRVELAQRTESAALPASLQ